jgi:hypothetical protein
MKASAAIRRDEEIMRSPEPRLSLNSLGFVQDHFMAHTTPENHLEEDISIHIFTVSSAMVGVCLTVIGLIRVVITFGKADTIADDLLAVDAFFFLVSCLLSYSALRTRSKRRMHRRERIADSIFILAMILMVVICGFITYAIAIPGK